MVVIMVVVVVVILVKGKWVGLRADGLATYMPAIKNGGEKEGNLTGQQQRQ